MKFKTIEKDRNTQGTSPNKNSTLLTDGLLPQNLHSRIPFDISLSVLIQTLGRWQGLLLSRCGTLKDIWCEDDEFSKYLKSN